MKKIIVFIIYIMIQILMNPAMASVGPIHVELNMFKPKLTHARANQVTSFTVYMRYNVNIKIHDWIKLWFPSSEAVEYACPEDLLKNICDGLPQIDENIDNPRFLPGKNFFEKYPNSKLNTKRQLFTVPEYNKPGLLYDNPEPGDVQNWSDVCGESDNKRRIIKDPSGLGCWMLGTVMPAIPVDDTERKEWSRRIGMSIAIGYNPCDCQPFSMTSTCKERLLTFIAPLEIDAWRKGYNSIDLNTGSYTGIVAPATPGRYRVFVATEPEPEPVESESFILPCSDVTDATFEEFPVRNRPTTFSVSFITGEGGALDNKRSTIRLRLPRNFRMKSITPKSILVNEMFVEQTKLTDASNGEQLLDITCPIDVENFGKVRIDFLNTGNFLSMLSADHDQLNVSTSSEPNFIPVKDAIDQSDAKMIVIPPEEYVNSDIYLTLPLNKGKTYPPNTEIKIVFNNGFELPDKPKPNCFQINGENVEAKIDKENLTLILTSQTKLSRKCLVSISAKSGIINPPAGIYDFNVFVGGDELFCQPFDIFISKPYIDQLELSNPQAAVQTKVSFVFRPSSKNPIKQGEEISIVFPAGTILPEQVSNDEVIIDGTQSKSVVVKDTTIKFSLPRAIEFRKPATIELKCYITNPRNRYGFCIKVICSGGNMALSKELTLIPAPLITTLVIERDINDQCDGNWYGRPPTITLECLNPEARIFFWFNGRQDSTIIFKEEIAPFSDCQVLNISWQAEFDGNKEQVRTKDIYLDTENPTADVFGGRSSTILTNQRVKLISGEVKPRAVRYYGNHETHVLIDSLFINFHGQETKIFEGGLFKKTEMKDLDLKFTHRLTLDQGENNVEVIARSLSCNQTTKEYKIMLDTTPPPIEMVSCPQSYKCFPGDQVKVSFRTERGLYAYCNNKVMPEESRDGMSSIFYTKYPVVQGKNRILLQAIDFAGNIAYKEIIFSANKTNTINLTLDKPSWDVNNEKQSDLPCSPTAKFTEEKLKALNGTTFVPFKPLAPFLGCSVEWNEVDKSITVIQRKGDEKNNTIIMWLGKNVAMVNGKQVKIGKNDSVCPVSINRTTMIPLRFVSENLGASLVFDSNTKQMSITYSR